MSTTQTAATTPDATAAAAAASSATTTATAGQTAEQTAATSTGTTQTTTAAASQSTQQTTTQTAPPQTAAGPPEKYALTLPDGGPLDQADVAELETLARTKGWTNEQAQAALTEHASSLTAQSDRFLTDTKAHAEIGGEQLAAAQQRARMVLDKFLPADSPEGQTFRRVMDKSGYGNYAPLVVLLSRIGKQLKEDTPVSADAARGGAPRDAASVLYGGQ